jgi:hypothetical protein
MRRTKRDESGSTLVLVLGAVVIAAMIAVSYLIFTDNLRERASRTLDQNQQEIAAEQGILEIERQVRRQLLSSASFDLDADQLLPVPGFSFSATVAGQAGTLLSVSSTVGVADIHSLLSLTNEDPFGAAKARVQLIDLTAISKIAPDGQQRLPSVQLTATPQIAVREIPVSQFTVYSAGDPFTIAPTPFDQGVGRVFSESSIAVAGDVSSLYPIVSKLQVIFKGASLKVADADSSNGPIGISSTDTDSNDFWAAARTQFDFRLITSDVLPVESAPLDQIYGASPGGGLNFDLLQAQCDLVVAAQVSAGSDPNNGYPVTTISKTGEFPLGSLSYPPSTNSGAKAGSNGGPSKQSVAFAAYSNKDNPTQVLLAFDYGKLPKSFTGSIYLVAQDSGGNPVGNAIIVIRGAKTLSGPLSIVSPHPIVIAGDFNHPTGVACSIITAQDVQTQPADWGSDSLGAL